MSAAVPERVEPSRPPLRQRLTRWLRDVLMIVTIALLASFLIRTFLVRTFYIPSESMEQTLLPDDRILVNELKPGWAPVGRGDIVVFRDPGGWLPPAPAQDQGIGGLFAEALTFLGLRPEDGHEYLVKRIIGLPGDHVTCCDADEHLEVNGTPIDEPYVMSSSASSSPFDVVVPEGAYFVLGDNREHSNDSRFNGMVPATDLVGEAFVIVWPLDRWRTLP